MMHLHINAASTPRVGCWYSVHETHGCHHIRPGGGCPGCGTHFCYACRHIYPEGGPYYPCPTGCATFCDDRCDCEDCPDCRPDEPCDHCDPGEQCWVRHPERRPAHRMPEGEQARSSLRLVEWAVSLRHAMDTGAPPADIDALLDQPSTWTATLRMVPWAVLDVDLMLDTMARYAAVQDVLIKVAVLFAHWAVVAPDAPLQAVNADMALSLACALCQSLQVQPLQDSCIIAEALEKLALMLPPESVTLLAFDDRALSALIASLWRFQAHINNRTGVWGPTEEGVARAREHILYVLALMANSGDYVRQHIAAQGVKDALIFSEHARATGLGLGCIRDILSHGAGPQLGPILSGTFQQCLNLAVRNVVTISDARFLGHLALVRVPFDPDSCEVQ